MDGGAAASFVDGGSRPVLFILGPTGSGKTRLAVEVALACDGEVVNADAMQLYEGLDIATAKATTEEMRGVPHHLLSVLDPADTWTVRDFRARAIDVIDGIHARGKLAIVVGGTNYYVESSLWETPMLLLDPPSSPTATAVSDVGAANQVADVPLIGKEGGGGGDETSGGMSLHERLRLVDPVMADRLHPNDTRKILNSLQAYARHGRPHSELLEEQAQQQQAGGGGGAVPLFERSAMVWLDCDDTVLRPRLDRRVDVMMERGMLDEVAQLWRETAAAMRERGSSAPGEGGGSPLAPADGVTAAVPSPSVPESSHRAPSPEPLSFEVGIFQAIGFKEFAPYLSAMEHGGGAAPASPSVLLECVDRVKSRTWKYVKRQRQWLRGRLARQSQVPVYCADSSDAESFGTQVVEPAIHMVRQSLLQASGERPNLSPHLVRCNPEAEAGPLGFRRDDERHERHECEACGVVRHGAVAWQQHLRSKQHRSSRRRRRRAEEEEAQGGGRMGERRQAVVDDTSSNTGRADGVVRDLAGHQGGGTGGCGEAEEGGLYGRHWLLGSDEEDEEEDGGLDVKVSGI